MVGITIMRLERKQTHLTTQSMGHGSVSPRGLLEIQILRPRPLLAESESTCNKLPRWLEYTLESRERQAGAGHP